MKLFIAMPFAKEFEPIYDAIKIIAQKTGLDPVRVDELHDPGPIISQIYNEIGSADFVVAEVSTRNANVFYEVGLAHCVRKPTLLIAERGSLADLPFDIRHNRVVVYDKRDLGSLREALGAHLSYFVRHLGKESKPPEPQTFFSVLADNKKPAALVLEHYVAEVAKEFRLTDPKLVETKYLSATEGYLIRLSDAFGEQVVFVVDPNGLVRQKKRLS